MEIGLAKQRPYELIAHQRLIVEWRSDIVPSISFCIPVVGAKR